MSIFQTAKRPSEKPENSKLINDDKVAAFYDIAVDTWKPQTDVWALKYGHFVLGVAGAMSGWYGNVYFRKKLRLRNYGFATMYLSNTCMPFLIVGAMQNEVALKAIYTRSNECLLCTEAKAAGIQLFFGLVQPLVLVPLSTFLFATRHFTHRIPSPIHYRKDFIRFVRQLYSPLKVPMTIISFAHVGLAMLMTHIQAEQFRYLNEEMLKPIKETTDDTD